MTDFRIHPSPLPFESAPGFLMRLFEINGAPWSRERFRTRGVRLAEILAGENDDAFRAFGLDPGLFSATTARVHSKKVVTVAGEELHRDDWSTHARRWCPCCFADDFRDESLGGRFPGWRPHRRFWWDVAAIPTCPIHKVRLERDCPTCGDHVAWETGSLTTCRCGHDLLSCDPVGVAEKDVTADAYVVGRLGAAPRVTAPFLDGLSLREAHDAMEHFGTAAVDGAFGALAKFDEARHPEVFSAGFRVAAGWPEAFERLLDDVAARPDVGLGSWGLDQVYGYLVMWARSIKNTPLGKPVYAAILAHYAKRSTVRAGSAAAEFVGSDAPVNVLQIGQALGIGSTLAKAHLIAHGMWPAETKRGTPVLFPPGTIAKLKAALDDEAAMEDLPDLLGIALNQAKALVAAGIVEPQAPDAKWHRIRRKFSRAKVAALVERLAGGAPRMKAAPEGMTDVMTACRYAAAGGIAGISKMILDGQVRVRGRLKGADGLRALVVDPVEIARANRAAVGADLDLRETGRLLGLDKDTVGTCTKAGLLECKTIGQKIVVPRAAAERFKKTYVTARELAEKLGTRERYLIETLSANGVSLAPASGPRRPSVAVFLRDRIPANLPHLHDAKWRQGSANCGKRRRPAPPGKRVPEATPSSPPRDEIGPTQTRRSACVSTSNRSTAPTTSAKP